MYSDHLGSSITGLTINACNFGWNDTGLLSDVCRHQHTQHNDCLQWPASQTALSSSCIFATTKVVDWSPHLLLQPNDILPAISYHTLRNTPHVTDSTVYYVQPCSLAVSYLVHIPSPKQRLVVCAKLYLVTPRSFKAAKF